MFTGVDKAGQFASGYTYVGGEPFTRWDPSGDTIVEVHGILYDIHDQTCTIDGCPGYNEVGSVGMYRDMGPDMGGLPPSQGGGGGSGGGSGGVGGTGTTDGSSDNSGENEGENGGQDQERIKDDRVARYAQIYAGAEIAEVGGGIAAGGTFLLLGEAVGLVAGATGVGLVLLGGGLAIYGGYLMLDGIFGDGPSADPKVQKELPDTSSVF